MRRCVRCGAKKESDAPLCEKCEREVRKQEPCTDAISREAVCEIISDIRDCISVEGYCAILERLKKLPPVTQKSGKCKDCKWWRDSDGVYRRGVGAESKCPINNVSVNHGFGYCYMFEPQESEEQTE